VAESQIEHMALVGAICDRDASDPINRDEVLVVLDATSDCGGAA
jgi:hypothetical protein